LIQTLAARVAAPHKVGLMQQVRCPLAGEAVRRCRASKKGKPGVLIGKRVTFQQQVSGPDAFPHQKSG